MALCSNSICGVRLLGLSSSPNSCPCYSSVWFADHGNPNVFWRAASRPSVKLAGLWWTNSKWTQFAPCQHGTAPSFKINIIGPMWHRALSKKGSSLSGNSLTINCTSCRNTKKLMGATWVPVYETTLQQFAQLPMRDWSTPTCWIYG